MNINNITAITSVNDQLTASNFDLDHTSLLVDVLSCRSDFSISVDDHDTEALFTHTWHPVASLVGYEGQTFATITPDNNVTLYWIGLSTVEQIAA